MGLLNYSYKKALYDELLENIQTSNSYYYAFAANPYSNGVVNTTITFSNYNYNYVNSWEMIFGKQLTVSNFLPVVNNNPWVANTVYNRYDNTVANLSNFYVVTAPSVIGGDYLVYKCIDNANGAPSTILPSMIQSNTFYTSDNYAWRYMYNISTFNYTAFASTSYIPVTPNSSIQTFAANNSGVDVVAIANSGFGYSSYHDGFIRGLNGNIIQIAPNASSTNYFYNNNAIYIYAPGNSSPSSSQLLIVSNYVSNTSGNWIYTNTPVNTQSIIVSETLYKISPAVTFTTDTQFPPRAYSIVDPTVNSIANVVVIDTGKNMTWAKVNLNTNINYGTSANLYAIVSPPGGHGAIPEVELGMQGYCVSFTFSNSESNTISTNISYNNIGIVKNPYQLTANATKSATPFTGFTFNELTSGNCSTTFTVGDTVSSNTTNSYGIVAFSNSTYLSISGDKTFANNELIKSTTNSANFGTLTISSSPSIYTKDIYPLYIQNLNNVQRSYNTSESYKIFLKI